jgi:hypothetical protein
MNNAMIKPLIKPKGKSKADMLFKNSIKQDVIKKLSENGLPKVGKTVTDALNSEWNALDYAGKEFWKAKELEDAIR